MASTKVPIELSSTPGIVDNSNATAITIDSSENVGIGTSSPEKILHIKTSVNNTAFARIESTATNSYPTLSLKNDAREYQLTTHGGVSDSFVIYDGTAGANRLVINTSGDVGIGTSSPDISGFSKALTIDSADSGIELASSGTIQGIFSANTQGAAITGVGSSGIRMFTSASGSASERMRIDSSGNLLVGCTSVPSGSTTGFAVRDLNYGWIHTSYDSTNARSHHIFYNPNGSVGSIQTSGSSTLYNTSSDARLKDITGEARGLEVINELNPVAYNWKADGKADEGLLAQEVLEIVPNAVTGSEEEYYQMDYSKLVTHLIAGMKEQQVLIEQLQAEVALLKGE